jgi:P-type conjugative transfer protein TrbJ
MRYFFIIILIYSSVANAGGWPTYDHVAMLQRLRAAVRQLRAYQLQIEQYKTNFEDIQRRAKKLDELRLNLKKKKGVTKKDLDNADRLLTGVIDQHEKTERLYDDVLQLKKNAEKKIKTGISKIASMVRKKADNISKQALSDEIRKGRKSLGSVDGIASNLKMLNDAAMKAKGDLQINQVIAMTNQQIAGLIKILTTVIGAQAETVQAEKIKKQAEENEAKEERDRFLNSQRAVCKPKKFLKTIPYPDGYDLGNPYE